MLIWVCRRFQPVKVPEPSVDETYLILQGLRERYEAHHKLTYTDEALQAAAKFSSQYISDRFLPDKVGAKHCCNASVGLHELHQLPQSGQECCIIYGWRAPDCL